MPSAPRPPKTTRRRVPGGRWLSVVLRAVHLAAVIAFGAAIHDAPLNASALAPGLFLSGALLFALDLYTYPQHLKEVAGFSVLLKLILVGALWACEDLRQPIFWAVVLWSAILSHAPGTLRHRRLHFPFSARRKPDTPDRGAL